MTAPRYSLLSALVALLTLAAAGGRAWLGRELDDGLDWVFMGEAAGGVVLLILLYAPLPLLPRDRSGIRALLGAWAVAMIVAYLVIASATQYSTVGITTVVLDLLLIVALIAEGRRVTPLGDEQFAVRHE